MSNTNKKPVSSLKYQKDHEGYPEFTRVSIPDSGHQGEEAGAIDGMPDKSTYDVFRHTFCRGKDPELYWLDKYRNDDDGTKMPQLETDIRSLYTHEDVRPEAIIKKMYEIREEESNEPNLFEDLYVDEDSGLDEVERLAGYYTHENNWRNRLILGDSLLVMNSLLSREGMKGQVQCVYIDPPYGIRYGGNWQIKINETLVKENDTNVSGEPEMIKAYRDTWEQGIHSYLSYLRDRLVLARELLCASGSCFVQISDSNVHLIRTIMDEVFGSENFCSQIIFRTKLMPLGGKTLEPICDFIIWYAKDKGQVKFHDLYISDSPVGNSRFNYVEYGGLRRKMSQAEIDNHSLLPEGARVFTLQPMRPTEYRANCDFPVEFEGVTYYPPLGTSWSTNKDGMQKLIQAGRIMPSGNTLCYVLYFDDYPVMKRNSLWNDTGPANSKVYVVQTSDRVIQRCILMTSDPGDLVLDPTCGSGTTAFVSEKWGRRWITIDTSRIALNLAKKRLVSATYPYYVTFDESEIPNLHLGFKYKSVPHVTLKSIAQSLRPEEVILYDQPVENKKKVRVTGPFTVETLQSLNVLSPSTLSRDMESAEEYNQFVDRIFNNLKSNGIRNGRKEQHIVFHSTEHIDEAYLNARGWFKDEKGENICVYFMIGPKFGTVSKLAVTEAIKAFRKHLEESSWLVILGFSFEDTIESGERKDVDFGTFQVSKVRMSDDLLQDGLLKKDKTAGSFIIIGEPDVELVKEDDNHYHVEIIGMDMYDPVKDVVKARNAEDIAYWEMDDDYTDSLFKVRSIHFSGGTHKEFAAWRKGLDSVAKDLAKKRVERTLRMQFNDELWDRLYSLKSESIEYRKGRKIAVRVVSQFGEEATRVLEMK